MRLQRVLTAFVLFLGLFIGLAAIPRPAAAATAMVNGDECTAQGIIDAIAEAGDGGRVTFDCESSTIYFNDWIDIYTTVTIDGSNNGNQMIFDGDDFSSFFEVIEGGNLTLEHLTMQNGYVGFLGGAIYNSGGVLTVNHCTFKNNGTSYFGGAINNGGTATINQSAFIENYAEGSFFSDGYGGAIENSGTLTVSQSTFLGNNASYGGAIDTIGDGTLTVISSTFLGNWVSGFDASVMQIDSPTIIQDSTIMHNDWPNALWVLDSLTLSNVILAGDGQSCALDGPDLVTDDHTLASDDSCGLTGERSQQNVADLGLLEAQTSTINGVEQTYFPLADDSPAINSGSTDCAAVDQIGNARPYNFYCDIGAIESAFTTTLLCANQWSGQMTMASDDGCDRSATMLNMITDVPFDFCVNKWNGAAQIGDQCGRSEYHLMVYGDQSISVCVNRWNNAIRVSDRCSRSERQSWL